MTDDEVRHPARELAELAVAVLTGLGTPDDIAAQIADSLVTANLLGYDSHGVRRLEPYAESARTGQIVPDARPDVAWSRGATALVDGHRGFGQPAARLATETAIGLATEYGTATVAVTACNHVGRLGEYVTRLAEGGLVGLAFCNADATVAPFGGRTRVLGTNPLAWSAPAGPDAPPLVMDYATSASAEGKLAVARDRGEQAPPGVLVDAAGNPSRDPADFYAGGALLPFGGHKGYGLGLMIDVIGGLLSGAGAASLPGYDNTNGTVITAIDVDRFRPLAEFRAQVEELRSVLHRAEPAAGGGPVRLPGEPEEDVRRDRIEHGIPVPAATWQALTALAGRGSV